ncbi:hypothetical protein Bbelb_352940 [Branchiostoma belcheri]|nr:hypothetical protein Bbelb_352940 [Branchiostoma belcheri]
MPSILLLGEPNVARESEARVDMKYNLRDFIAGDYALLVLSTVCLVHLTVSPAPCSISNTSVKKSAGKTNMVAATKLSVLPPDLGLPFFGSEEVSERAKQKGYSFFVEGYVRRVEIYCSDGKAHYMVSSDHD